MSEVKEKQDEMLSEKNVEEDSLKTKTQTSSRKRKAENDDPVSSTKCYVTSADLDVDKNERVKKCIENSVLVARHYNSLKNINTCVRYKSRILYMRNFNNWIKGMLMGEYTDEIKNKPRSFPIIALDMCCGKGGDLFKWNKINITHLICADLAEVTMQQCQRRYQDLLRKTSQDTYRCNPLFTAEFITADCTKVRLRKEFKDASMPLDLVSCQFAFHYCFESLQQAECMMRNASECLKPGGYFIGTIPDAYELVSRWQRCDGNSFGNDFYNVEFFCDKKNPPLFGAKYHFQLEGVVNCPEFLVYLPVFSKLALKYGLEMKLFERFDKFYERMKNKGSLLLTKIQGLEIYPPHGDTQLVGNAEQDYQHAKEFLQNSPTYYNVGTLSQPEWEIVSLYCVFGFEKMKTLWNSKGEPEYVKS